MNEIGWPRCARLGTAVGLWVLSAAMLPATSVSGAAAESGVPPNQPESHSTYLLLDSRVVGEARGVRLVLGPVRKHPANPLFGEDRPWEPRGDNYYANVLYDEEERVYKCWYNPFVTSELDEQTPRAERKNVKWHVSNRMFGLCYATSTDGLHWEKPNLGLTEFRESKENNILLLRVHGPGIVKDMNESDPQRRYKMIGAVDGLGAHRVWCSPDGLRWGAPEIHENIGGRRFGRSKWLARVRRSGVRCRIRE